MAKRLALLVGSSKFEDERVFPNLFTPLNDAHDFATVLEEQGDFEISGVLIDASVEVIKRAIEDLYNTAEAGDLTLFYYSGHGYRDKHGRYFLIASNSWSDHLLTSAIRETFVHDAMRGSRSKHRIIILDCCFSGAFIKGGKSGTVPLTLRELKGEATAILASSGIVQYSFEEKGRNSLFTRFLLHGIVAGEADRGRKGYISIDDVFYYAEQNVREVRPEQTPIMELGVRRNEVIIARNPTIVTPGDSEGLSSRKRIVLSRSVSTSSDVPLPRSTLFVRGHFSRNQIVSNLLTEYGLKADTDVMSEFSRLNQARQAKGLKENYNATRFRVICPPMISASTIELFLAPIDFAFAAVLKEQNANLELKRHMLKRVEAIESKIPSSLRSAHQHFNFRNFSMLGVQVCLITSDNQTHLRKRGSSVLFANGSWDVSVSGFCGETDMIGDQLDLGLTVEHEVQREIALLRGDPRLMVFTGLHKNSRTGANDFLVYWHIQTTARELVREIIWHEPPRVTEVFDTTRKAVEPFVWDTRNIVVPFDPSSILSALDACDVDLLDFEPQSLLCIELALLAYGKKGLGLKTKRLHSDRSSKAVRASAE